MKSSPRSSLAALSGPLACAFSIFLLSSSIAVAATCPSGLGPRETPTADFVVNANGTVSHIVTGLMWKQCSEGLSGSACGTGSAIKLTWANALIGAKDSNFAGYADWRVPSKAELESIIDASCHSPAINDTVFPNTPAGDGAWTSTTNADFPRDAFLVFFTTGNSGLGGVHKPNPKFVRLVRIGQSFDALAQCNLDVNGDGLTTADKDGVLLLRYLLGFRGAALIAGIPVTAARGSADDVANFIGLASKYDVFGRTTPSATPTQDGVVLTRLMLQIPDNGLLDGVPVPSGATNMSAGAVRAAVNLRCGTTF
jgi:hypothetical protein